MENDPVTLIVKAPNQQVEDIHIQCELSWTIKRLKGYLSEVYPSKPVSITILNIPNEKNVCFSNEHVLLCNVYERTYIFCI